LQSKPYFRKKIIKINWGSKWWPGYSG